MAVVVVMVDVVLAVSGVAMVVVTVKVAMAVVMAVVPVTEVAVKQQAAVSSVMVTAVVLVRSLRMSSMTKNLRTMNLNQQQQAQHFSLVVGHPVTYRMPLVWEVVVGLLVQVEVHRFAYGWLVVLPQA